MYFLDDINLQVSGLNLKQITFHSGGWKWKLLSYVQVFVTPWVVARQAPLSIWFPRQEHWSGLPFSSLGDLSNPGIESTSAALQADS